MTIRITCKVCRRLGFSVCGKTKCASRRKPYPPGIHGRGSKRGRRRMISEYGAQLREKQKLKFLYGLNERPFKNLVSRASAAKGTDTTRRVIELLERRLDNVVFRLGFAPSRRAARQMVSHRHILVDLRPVTIPSYTVKIGQSIQIRPRSLSLGLFRDLDLHLKKYEPPSWLLLDKEKKECRVAVSPRADEAESGINLPAIIEFYSR